MKKPLKSQAMTEAHTWAFLSWHRLEVAVTEIEKQAVSDSQAFFHLSIGISLDHTFRMTSFYVASRRRNTNPSRKQEAKRIRFPSQRGLDRALQAFFAAYFTGMNGFIGLRRPT